VQERVRALNDAPVNSQAKYVLYCPAERRVDSNHALLHAVERATNWACRFCVTNPELRGQACERPPAPVHLGGRTEQARRLERLGVGYCFLLRRRNSEPKTS